MLDANENKILRVVGKDSNNKDIEEDIPVAHWAPLTKITEPVMKKVLEWCTHHRNDPPTSQEDDGDNRKKSTDIEEWDQKFMQVDQEMLFEVILVSHLGDVSCFRLSADPNSQAANYLDIKALLDVGCKTVANMIKGKSPEEIRKTFNIQNDFTPEEEDQIRRENEWAEEYVPFQLIINPHANN